MFSKKLNRWYVISKYELRNFNNVRVKKELK